MQKSFITKKIQEVQNYFYSTKINRINMALNKYAS